MSEVALRVSGVSKDFRLPHKNQSSIKSLFINPLNVISKKNDASEVQHALKNISFEIKKGEFFGIVGRNGSGKSTLLKIMAGIYQSTKGTVRVEGKLVPFIELGVGFNPELSGRENIYLNGALLGFDQKRVEAKYKDIVSFAELERFMDQKLKNYSSGMQVRLAFSVATVLAESDILLIDEVLAVGDADFQRKCFRYFKELKKESKTVIFVSHDMDAIREYCDRAVLIEKSQIIEEGSPHEIASSYSKLFIKETNLSQSKQGKRWGNGDITYNKIAVRKNITTQTTIKITTESTAHTSVENPVYGFIIRDAAGQPLLGTNSRIKNKKFEKVTSGSTLKVDWLVPNIFSDGEYFIDPAIVRGDDNEVIDWCESMASFSVYKEEKTPYIVTPDIGLELKIT